MQVSKSGVVRFYGEEGSFLSVLTCLKGYRVSDVYELLVVFLRATGKIGSSEKILCSCM